MAVKPDKFAPLLLQADTKLVAALIEKIDAALANPLADVVRVEEYDKQTVRIAIPTGLTMRSLTRKEADLIEKAYLEAGWDEAKLTGFEQRIALTLKLPRGAYGSWHDARHNAGISAP